MRPWIVLLLASLLGACGSLPTGRMDPSQTALLRDEAFAPAAQPIRAADVFALSDEMRRFLASPAFNSSRRDEERRSLVDKLYHEQALKLEYDSSHTRNAAEAFSARSGNCLSLVIMTAAFARELGVPVYFQAADMEDSWSRNGNLMLSSNHVNITLGRRLLDRNNAYDTAFFVVVDFLPAEEIRGLRTHSIGEKTVVAMYMNNRAAEALANGQVDDAYWWTREAIRQDPGFAAAYNTLGVVYLHRGLMAEAERSFAQVLETDPRNTTALSNRVLALRTLGRQQEATQVANELARLEPHPPFQFFDLGMKAMRSGDYRTAREWFSKEVARAPYYHEFQFWLGMAELRLGNLESAKSHIEQAAENSTTHDDKAIYSAKLDHLKAMRRVQ